eukprot:Ihof_evm12s3 gene=Ihof_evmTU12s3
MISNSCGAMGDMMNQCVPIVSQYPNNTMAMIAQDMNPVGVGMHMGMDYLPIGIKPCDQMNRIGGLMPLQNYFNNMIDCQQPIESIDHSFQPMTAPNLGNEPITLVSTDTNTQSTTHAGQGIKSFIGKEITLYGQKEKGVGFRCLGPMEINTNGQGKVSIDQINNNTKPMNGE